MPASPQPLKSSLRRLLSRGAPRILLGSLVGQGAVLCVSPWLTRLYSPSGFAALAAITSISAVLGGVVTLSWERAIVVPRSDSDAHALVRLGIASVVVLSLGVTLVAWLMRSRAAELMNTEVFIQYWWLTPCTVFLIGLYAIASSALVRAQAYRDLAVRNGVQGTAQAVSSVVLGIFGVAPLGLASGPAIGRLASLVGMAKTRRVHRIADRKVGSLLRVAYTYRRFPLVNIWSRLLNSLGLQLPTLLIIALYGTVEAGLYALTLRVLASPVGIVSDAVSQSFEGSFARRSREEVGGLRSQILRSATRLAFLGIGPAIVLAALSGLLFNVVFGAEWYRSGGYAQILAFAYLAQFIVVPVSRSLLILERQGLQLAWDLSRFALTLTAVLTPWALGGSFVWCVVALACAQTLSYGALLWACSHAARKADLLAGPERCSSA